MEKGKKEIFTFPSVVFFTQPLRPNSTALFWVKSLFVPVSYTMGRRSRDGCKHTGIQHLYR